MFLGTYSSVFPRNHRVAVPFSFRKSLGTKFILTKWYENSLVLIAHETWQALWQRLSGKEEMLISQIRDTERFFLAGAYEIEPDNQGRIVIPERLVKFAGLVENIVFLGVGDRVEIWNEKTWTKKEEALRLEVSGLIRELADARR